MLPAQYAKSIEKREGNPSPLSYFLQYIEKLNVTCQNEKNVRCMALKWGKYIPVIVLILVILIMIAINATKSKTENETRTSETFYEYNETGNLD